MKPFKIASAYQNAFRTGNKKLISKLSEVTKAANGGWDFTYHRKGYEIVYNNRAKTIDVVTEFSSSTVFVK